MLLVFQAEDDGVYPPGRGEEILRQSVSGTRFLDPPLTEHGIEQCHELRRRLEVDEWLWCLVGDASSFGVR